MTSVYLGLGTNLGDRRVNVQRALGMLDDAFGVHWSKLSSILETEPWGFESDNRFLNCAVRYDLDLDESHIVDEGLKILSICKDIERTMGRSEHIEFRDGRRVYHSRIIDIDILLMGQYHFDVAVGNGGNANKLVVPHPLMEERDFVMVPLREIM